jgi:hypothetical protein
MGPLTPAMRADLQANTGPLDVEICWDRRGLVAEEMADGALGIASVLIYPPGSYATTEELIEVCRAAAGYDGCYASHIRNEGAGLPGAIEEFLAICRRAGLRGEVFHLKAAGQDSAARSGLNWRAPGGAGAGRSRGALGPGGALTAGPGGLTICQESFLTVRADQPPLAVSQHQEKEPP